MRNSKEKFVCFLTGASGVGKTTLADYLAKKYKNDPSIKILHFDSIGVPSSEDMIAEYGSGTEWQRAMTKKWVDKILNEFNELFVILEGQVNIDFIAEAFEEHNFINYKIILIDCGEETMVERLVVKRGQPELVTSDMKNWLSFLRNQAKTQKVQIIDTSNKNINEVAQMFESYIEA